MFEIVVLASCGGGNFENLVNKQKQLGYKITYLITDRVCEAIDKAHKLNINNIIIDKKNMNSEEFFENLNQSIPEKTDLIVCAGFLPIISEAFSEKWKGKIINTHPSLLPKYGGKGMYGVKVHEAVLKNKEEETGCTVHYVDSGIDTGEIIIQKKMPVDNTWTPWELGGHVFKLETKALIDAIQILMKKS